MILDLIYHKYNENLSKENKNKITKLIFSCNGLTIIPKNIFDLINLTILNIEYN